MEALPDGQLIEADDRLAMVFSHYYCIERPADAPPLRRHLMPNYEMLLVFNFGPEVPVKLGNHEYRIRRTAVLGPLQKTLTYDLPGGAELIIVNFTLNGFYRLMRVPMHEFRADDLHHPDLLLDKAGFGDLWTQLAESPNRSDRLNRISDYLQTSVAPIDEAACSLLDTIPYFRNPSLEPVKGVAGTHGLTARSVQQRFQIQLGFTAKEMVRFLRFKRVLAELGKPGPDAPVDWVQLVERFGYHDQPHLIRDFRYYVGLTPRRFLRQLAGGGVCVSPSGRFY
ncbi:AraC family transcriptional regulator [Larkinella soli]|uniref:AraC family transcriptional regulator n=1 Tax=Larkinella soli TaxID=1770527 RepID=UPI000FFB8D05|nr:helix-turn-helix domain-containing protein [Larkinella soli]